MEVCLLTYCDNVEVFDASQSLSISLQDGIRFFHDPISATSSARLTTHFPQREGYGLTTFRLSTTDG